MGMLDGLVPGNDPRLKRLLQRRIEGRERQASTEARGAALQSARDNAASTAARARDAGISGGLAERLASRQQTAGTTAANQQFAQDRRREVDAAEQGLADLKAQRGAFMRQLLGKGLSGAGALAGKLGMGGESAGGGGGPQGISSAGGFAPAQGGGLGALGGIAGTAVGGPLGGMVGSQLGGALGPGAPAQGAGQDRMWRAEPQTMAMVDSAMAGFPGGPGERAPAMSPIQQQVQAGLQTPGLGQVAQGGQLPPEFWRQLLGGF